MASSPLTVAILGVGRWGSHLLRNFQQQPNAQVVAVCDPDPSRLAQLARACQLSPATLLTDNWRQVLSLSGLQAVVIATPASSHYELARAALAQDLHILVEKPLALTLAEAQALCHLAQQRQRQLVVDHTYLFNPAVQTIAQQVQAGAIGELRYGYAARTHLGPVRQDVDALWDLAIHDIAMFNAWTGSQPLRVQAMGHTWLQPGLADLVWARLTYATGFEATLHLCWSNADKQRRSTLVGSGGSLVFDELQPEALVTLHRGQLEPVAGKVLLRDQSRQVLPVVASEPLASVCGHFLDCVQQNQASALSSGSVGADLVSVLVALTQSLQTQGAWQEVSPG